MRHAGSRFRPEILDDDFLDVSITVVERAQSKQRVDPFLARLSDADQNARGERHALLAGGTDAREPPARVLIGRAVMGAAARAQPLRHGFEHQPLGHRDRPQDGRIGRRQMAWIEVRQQSGLLVHRACRLCEIRQRRAVSKAGKRIGSNSIA